MAQELIDGRRRVVYLFWFIVTVGVVLLAAVPILAVLGPWTGRPVARGLSVEPRTVDLTDRVAKEDEYVSGRFEITNPLDRPVIVKQFMTSCGCMASTFEDGRELPLFLGPGGTAAFVMRGHTAAQIEQTQRFYTTIVSECDGRALPEISVALHCRVEDPLKAFPPSIILGGLPGDLPTRRRLALATQSPATKVEAARVSSSDPNSILVELNPNRAGGLDGEGRYTRYDLDVTLVPQAEREALSGVIEVVCGDQRFSIPVECTFKRPYRLSQAIVEAEGRPGEVVSSEVFYEFTEPAWSSPRIVHSPVGVDAEIASFDSSTKVLKMRIHLPRGSAPGGQRAGSAQASASDEGRSIGLSPEALTLGFEGQEAQIQVPIKISLVVP